MTEPSTSASANARVRRSDRALAAIASGSAAPYGYTVTLWSSGAVLSHAHGAPDIGRIALFMLGAIAGYGFFGSVARRRAPDSKGDHASDVRVLAGMLNWFGVGTAVAAAWLAAQLPPSPAWALGSAAATVVYLTMAVVQLDAIEARAHR